MIGTGIPNVMDVGFKIKQKRDFQKNFNLAMSGGQPAPPAQPAPLDTATTAPIQRPSLSVENLTAGGTGVKMRSNLPEQPPTPATTNALLGASGLPTNFGDNVLGQINELERQRKGLSMLAAENPQITPMVAELSRQIAELRRPQTFSPGQTVVFPGQAPITLPEKSEAQPSLVREYNFAKTQDGGGFKGSYQDFVVARSAATRTPAQPLAPVPALDKTTNQVVYATREQILQNPGRFVPVSEKQEPGVVATTLTDETGKVTLLDKFGKPVGEPMPGAGKPSASFTKLRDQRAQLGRDLGAAITELTDITKDGGLIDQSTGSGVGRLVDVGKGFFGGTTPGAIATAKLKPIQDLVLKTIPRFEGPQSDKDTQSYKEAAGQLADPNMPTAIRKEAAKTVLRLMTARKNQFVTPEMAAEGAGGAPSTPSVVDFGSLR
jgi:hypothetical protein